jgi:hypothetical protein
MRPLADRWRWRHYNWRIDMAVWPGALIALAYTIYGLGMVLQPRRFGGTPSYGNLTQLLDIRVWGAMYLAMAVLFGVYTLLLTARTFGIVTHMIGLTVTGTWLVAFLIRWLTDPNTTVVNVASWLVLTLLIARSATLIPASARPDRGPA